MQLSYDVYIYIWLVTVFSLYFNTTGVRRGPGKMLLGSWKCPGNFCNQESGNSASSSNSNGVHVHSFYSY